MRVVFLKTNQTCRLSLAVERLHTVVLGKVPQFIHCGFEVDGLYIHATLDGVIQEPWRRAYGRYCGYTYHIDNRNIVYWETLHGINILNHMRYTIGYRDWWSMLYHRPSHNCADFVARAMGLYKFNDKLVMPDDLHQYFSQLDNSS